MRAEGDAIKLPSVTQILRGFGGYENIPPEVLEKAAARGIEVHEACYRHALGIWSPKPVSEEARGYVESFKRWAEKWLVGVIAAEEEYLDPTYRIKGHPDLVCRLRHEERPVIVDYKTPVTRNRTWCLQLAGYLHLVREAGIEASRAFVLQLHKDGRMARAVSYAEQARDLSAFLAAAQVYNYIHSN
jgi:hypothetical protein